LHERRRTGFTLYSSIIIDPRIIMKIVLLGTNGYGPSNDGHTACFMLPELGIVLDAGSGLFRIADYLQTPRLDIYLSHAHMDHIIGLTFLWGALLNKVAQETDTDKLADFASLEKKTNEMAKNICIYATESVFKGVEERLGLWSDMNWKTLAEKQPLPENGTLSHFPLEHGVPCFGFRLDWPGHSLAYVTDTIAGRDAPYLEHLRGVDLLLHDSYLPDMWSDFARTTSHSHTSAAAQVAAHAGVKRLLLIHHNTIGLRVDGTELARAQMIFANTQVGLDGMEIEF
jgi:ribonuclease BN (tRNA processing enzyme)